MRKFVGSEYGSLDAFALTEGEIPQPAQGEARLKVEAAALGFVDGLIALGRYQIRPPLPYVPGGEIAGTVDATGPGVDAVVIGDRVVTWQLGEGLAEYVTVEARAVDKIPAGLDATTAAAMLVDYQTAHYALFERGQLRSGETVLVLGATGGVGSAAVQLAARAEAYGHLEKFVLSGCEVRCLGEKRFLRVLKGALSRSRGWVALAKGCLRRRWAPAWWRCALSPAMRAWPSAPGRPIG